LCLAEDVRGTLLGDLAAENPLTRIYQLILACERAEWDEVSLLAGRLGSPAEVVSDLYLEAVRWSAEIFHAGDPVRGPDEDLRIPRCTVAGSDAPPYSRSNEGNM
jgi:hypothetical protein